MGGVALINVFVTFENSAKRNLNIKLHTRGGHGPGWAPNLEEPDLPVLKCNGPGRAG